MARTEMHNETLATGDRPPLPVVLPIQEVVRCRSWWRGIFWGEWQGHNRLILCFLGAWLANVWILPQFANSGWILMFGFVFALIAGPAIGGKDVLEGCEEYVFALSITRAEWFAIRWAAGAGLLILFTVLDLLALGLDLSQATTRFYLDMGLMDPKGALQHPFLYGLILLFPLACYSIAFSLAANARGRGGVLSSWIWAGFGSLVVLRLGLLYEYWEWKVWTGYFSCPALILAIVGSTAIGLQRFRAKEVVGPSKPWNMPAYWWMWVLLTLCALGTITFLVSSLGKELANILGK